MITMLVPKIVVVHLLDANMMKYPAMIKMLVLRTLVTEILDVKTTKLYVMIMIYVPMILVILPPDVFSLVLSVTTITNVLKTYALKPLVANILK
jgi:hypothetical protein